MISIEWVRDFSLTKYFPRGHGLPSLSLWASDSAMNIDRRAAILVNQCRLVKSYTVVRQHYINHFRRRSQPAFVLLDRLWPYHRLLRVSYPRGFRLWYAWRRRHRLQNSISSLQQITVWIEVFLLHSLPPNELSYSRVLVSSMICMTVLADFLLRWASINPILPVGSCEKQGFRWTCHRNLIPYDFHLNSSAPRGQMLWCSLWDTHLIVKDIFQDAK